MFMGAAGFTLSSEKASRWWGREDQEAREGRKVPAD
jgi:hypothetical protein